MAVHLELRTGTVGKITCRKERRGRSSALISSFDLNGSLCEYEEAFDITKAGPSGMPPSSICEGDQIIAAGKPTPNGTFSTVALKITTRDKILGDDGLALILGGVGFLVVSAMIGFAIIDLHSKSASLFIQAMWALFCVSAGTAFMYSGMRFRTARQMIKTPVN